MASSWTRIHQELSLPPGPLTFHMIERATKEIDGERDDLDWKRELPKKPEAGAWSEFAKDVAAMANARGGLLVYGVRNDCTLTGVDSDAVPTEHLYKWLRAHTQPFVGGVDIYSLRSADAARTVLVVDVPASPMAPHFVLGTSSRDKEQQAFAVPARFTDHTTWLSEHEIERAYRDRFTRQVEASKALDQHLAETREVVLAEGDPSSAWLIVVSRPSRPTPPLVPPPERHEARYLMNAALATAKEIRGESGESPMRNALSGAPTVGLRRWVEGNFLQPLRGSAPGRLLMMELHHDGTVVYAVDLSGKVLKNGTAGLNIGRNAPVETRMVQTGVCDAVALSHEVRLARRLDCSADLVAAIVCDPDQHSVSASRTIFAGYIPVLENHGFLDVPTNARCPVAVRPTGYELPPIAAIDDLRAAAASLASGLINQFGIESHFL
ncbi:helix-turn-helix domain-containing protein [Streptomyces sp. NPDC058467]|uniref:AlbA family DNA-binding domain-containing protein n=1 Tax=Streptomyces sp. NPDC058467 TaxID=3346513 RepID=UPI0036601B3B